MGGLYKQKPRDLNALIHNYLLIENKDKETAVAILLENLRANDAVKIDLREKLRNGGDDKDIKILNSILLNEAKNIKDEGKAKVDEGKAKVDEGKAKVVVIVLKAIAIAQQQHKQKTVESQSRVEPIQSSIANTKEMNYLANELKNRTAPQLPDVTLADYNKQIIDNLNELKKLLKKQYHSVNKYDSSYIDVAKIINHFEKQIDEFNHDLLNGTPDVNRNQPLWVNRMSQLAGDIKIQLSSTLNESQELNRIYDNFSKIAKNKPTVKQFNPPTKTDATPLPGSEIEKQREMMLDIISKAMQETNDFKSKVDNKSNGNPLKAMYKGAKKNILPLLDMKHNTKSELADSLLKRLAHLKDDVKFRQIKPEQVPAALESIFKDMKREGLEVAHLVTPQTNEFNNLVDRLSNNSTKEVPNQRNKNK